MGGCGILLGDDGGQAPRDIIRRRVLALPYLHRNGAMDIFPKSCPKCIGINLICAAQVLGDSKIVHEVINEMLQDPKGRAYPSKRSVIFNSRVCNVGLDMVMVITIATRLWEIALTSALVEGTSREQSMSSFDV